VLKLRKRGKLLMKKRMQKVYRFFLSDLWSLDQSSFGRVRSGLIEALRIVTIVVRDVTAGEITLRAMGLVYTTLLSLVPLLAVSFSVLKAFGVHNMLEPFLVNLLMPLGPTAVDVADHIIGFVNNMKVSVLGFMGLGLLVYTVISLIQKIEEAFNAIWHVRSLRTILQRFSDYLSVIVIGPVLVVSALGLTASLMSTEIMQRLVAIGPVGIIVSAMGSMVPYILVCAAFAFIYLFVPNTKVRVAPAIAGAVAGGVLWETVGWGFGSFIVASARYGAIYSGFAVLVLFMLWLYLSWLILLVGAEIAFYTQNRQYLTMERDVNSRDARFLEQLALSVMFLVARNFHSNAPPWTVDDLGRRLGVLPERLASIAEALKQAGLLAETASDPPSFLPARDIETIAVRQVYDAVRRAGSSERGRVAAVGGEVKNVMAAVDAAIDTALEGWTLRDMVRSEEETRKADAA
jgi:membrane protein